MIDFTKALVFTAAMSLIAGTANANLIINPSFEDTTGSVVFPTGTGKPGPGSFFLYRSIPGWSAIPGTIPFELQNNVVSVGPAFHGDLHLELDAIVNSRVRQTVVTTVGQHYELSFYYSPRRGQEQDSNAVVALWDGSVVDTIAETGIGLLSTTWSLRTYEVVASSTTTDLDFLGGGSGGGNGFGGLIDLVSLVEIDNVNGNGTMPEPSTLALFGVGLAGLGFLKRRKARFRR